jgi:hypothetical protein
MRGNQLWQYDAEVQYFLQLTHYLMLKFSSILQKQLNLKLFFCTGRIIPKTRELISDNIRLHMI